MTVRPLRLWVWVLILEFLFGCAGPAIELPPDATLPETEGVAFGQVRLTSDGEEQNLSSFLGESKLSVILLADDDQAPIRHHLRDEGYFFWHLPPGTYTITSFQGLTPEFLSSHMKGRIFARFNVLEDLATYIGTLNIAMTGHQYGLFIENDSPRALPKFKERFPNIDLETKTDIMILEPRR